MKQIKAELEKAIDAFNRKDSQTQTTSVTVNQQKYFIKICGTQRGKYTDNEVDSLKCLSQLSPFYRDYFVTSMTKNGKTGIVLKFIEGTDMYEMISSKKRWEMSFLTKMYKLLLSKIRVYHNNLMTHGDIKATNFYIHTCENGDMDVDLIDTESVNNFNVDHRKKNKGKYINFISDNYDFPVKLKRGKINFSSHKNAFLFYKYLDLYAVSVLILFMYKPRIYRMLKTKGTKDNVWKIGKRQRRPTEFVQHQKNNLEKALYYVFSFLPFVEKVNQEIIRIDDIPVSHTQILEILDS